VTIGMLGKTGWYISYSRPFDVSYDYCLESNKHDLNFDTYYLSPSDPMRLILNHSTISLGITFPVHRTRNLFFTTGISRIRSSCLQYFDKIPYNREMPVTKTLVFRKDKNFKAAGFDAGIVFRINNCILISIASSSFFDRLPEWDPKTDKNIYSYKYATTNYKLGLGYNF
jgi:hypothetical protein